MEEGGGWGGLGQAHIILDGCVPEHTINVWK